jgi:hypothetical protein
MQKWMLYGFVAIVIIIFLFLINNNAEYFSDYGCPNPTNAEDICVINKDVETINATVPRRVPLTSRDLSFIGQIDCTVDIDCDYPLKCCNGKCKPPVVRQDNKPDCRFIPMRIKTC